MTPLSPVSRRSEGERSGCAAAPALGILLWLLALDASAASRARYGGTLKIAASAKATETEPVLADTPLEATLVSLINRPLCRLERSGAVSWLLVSELTHASATSLRLTLRPSLVRATGTELSAADVASGLTHLATSSSPYRALLAPLKAASATELTLAFPFPDFERALCHPALAPRGVGPFRFVNAQSSTANVFFPEGRPYADALAIVSTDARAAERALQQHKANLALGLGAAADEGNLLYATFLSFNAAKVGPDFRAAFESAVERSDLTRFFVHPPAAPMPQLLPPVLATGMAEPPRLPRPAPLAMPRELVLAYDAAVEDHRAVAERLQVKLHSLGYRIALKALTRSALRSDGAGHDLALQSVLVPPVPTLAIALALELGGRHDQLPAQLAVLGAIAEEKGRARAAQALAERIWLELPLIPLYAQGLGLQSSAQVQNLKTDAFGLPLLDAVFLGQD